jgi:UDP-N-acetylglucosamine/UDP-N-acetylgalactosamine diphosphorylase
MASDEIGALRRRFAHFGQEHVFRFWDRLDAEGRARLARQAAGLDLSALARLRATTREMLAPGRRRLEPAPVVRLPEHGGDPELAARARERGEALLAAGSVAALVVAGGQGTRLGLDAPKGCFPIGPVTGRSLFGLQAQKLRGLRRRYGKPVPWYVMTSRATDAATRAFFEAEGCFGLPPDEVFFFEQGSLPCLDFEGRLLLERPDRIAESPDGHGGSLPALERSGAFDDLERRGVGTLAYYQVDNPLVRIADPVYLGFHAEARAEMSCKVIRKREPGEKMGVVARVDGRTAIVEYTELDDAHRHLRGVDGELLYWAGSIAVHLLDVAFARRVARDAERLLPSHASAKKIRCVDADGRECDPSAPNGYKLERFVFDALPAAARTVVVEARREHEYSPIKNAEGADSPHTARRDLEAEYRRWLAAGGIAVPEGASRIEIDHSLIDGPDDARESGIREAARAGEAVRLAEGAPA